ncbi:hypothetical protein SH528x_003417 [Novipirellula sp. SH528]|uniref:hypothetical protein n=1 Tax=Novipirellula sp. SH528 TaxID=3454466 RepID=UPI003FA1384B
MRSEPTIVFAKTGAEIKAAVRERCHQIQQRLDRRLSALDNFLADNKMVRSYMIRTSAYRGMHGSGDPELWTKEDISSEQLEETRKTCERIYELQQELRRLQLLIKHLADDQEFKLALDDLISYGFQVDE